MYQSSIEERLKKHLEKEVPTNLKERVMNEISFHLHNSKPQSVNKFKLAFAIVGVLTILTAYTDDKIRLGNTPNIAKIYPNQIIYQQKMMVQLFEDERYQLKLKEETIDETKQP